MTASKSTQYWLKHAGACSMFERKDKLAYATVSGIILDICVGLRLLQAWDRSFVVVGVVVVGVRVGVRVVGVRVEVRVEVRVVVVVGGCCCCCWGCCCYSVCKHGLDFVVVLLSIFNCLFFLLFVFIV